MSSSLVEMVGGVVMEISIQKCKLLIKFTLSTRLLSFFVTGVGHGSQGHEWCERCAAGVDQRFARA